MTSKDISNALLIPTHVPGTRYPGLLKKKNNTTGWCHDMEMPHKGPVIGSFGIIFIAMPNQLLENSRISSDLRRHGAHVTYP